MTLFRRVRAPLGVVVFLALFAAAVPANASYGPKPAKWCGWQMRQEVGQDPGRAYNLAINWKNYGRPADGPSVGVIVVWPHHVGKIVGRDGRGQWIIRSGNDGNALRERARSLSKVVAYRWPA